MKYNYLAEQSRAEQSRAEQSRAEQSRSILIDFIRGIAIVLVVLGHNIQYGSGNDFFSTNAYFGNWLFKLIYCFHMPLFALISGYLFFESINKNINIIFKKKFISLLVPLFCWKTIEYTTKGIIQMIMEDFDVLLFIKKYISSTLHSFWFLWAIFWCSLIVIIVEKKLKGISWVYLFLLIFMLFAPSKLNSHLYIYIYPYFILGFLFNKHNYLEIYRNKIGKDIYIFFLSFLIFFMLFKLYDYDSYIYTTKVCLISKKSILSQLSIDIYRWTIGFFGSIVIILICENICNKRNKKIIEKIINIVKELGQISIGIYILSSYAFEYLIPKLTSYFTPNILIWIVETVISILIYYFVIKTIKKSHIISKLLLGRKY